MEEIDRVFILNTAYKSDKIDGAYFTKNSIPSEI